MKTKRAFTLIELLVVMAVVAILAALLLPSLARANDQARRTECMGNLKQVSLALRLYGDDYVDSLPVLPSPNPYPNGIGAYPNAKSVLSFVDGHVNYSRIYWDGILGSRPCSYEPPDGYEYAWGDE